MKAVKTKRREGLLNLVCEAIVHDDIFGTIAYRNKTEDQIKQFIYPHLLDQLSDRIVESRGVDKTSAKDIIRKSLKWEGDVKTTVHHILFMGTRNRPDMVLDIDGISIAIEFKKGQRGNDLRSGIGQSMVYATQYDFVIYLFIDTSEDGRINNAKTGQIESDFINMLWKNHNIMFIVK